MTADRSPDGSWERVVCGVVLLSIVFLQWQSIERHSLTGDGAYHLLAGEQMLRSGQNLSNLEHPPLAKLVMALPRVGVEAPLVPTFTVDHALGAIDRAHERPGPLLDATRWARVAMLLTFGLPLLAGAWLLGRRWGGRRTGWLLLVMMACSSSALPYLAILQTDAAVALGFVGSVLALERLVATKKRRWALVAGVMWGIGLAVKYSALLLLPTFVIGIVLVQVSIRRRALLATGVLVAAIAVVGSSYALANHDYDAEAGRDTLRRYCRGQGTLVVGDAMRDAEPWLLAIEHRSPGLAQWLAGLHGIRLQNRLGIYPSYAFGTVRPEGRWWYFPAVLAVKTPLVLVLAMFALGIEAVWRRRAFSLRGRSIAQARWLLAGVTVAVYLIVAMSSSYNLGVRHLLPIMPFLFLPIALGLARLPRASLVVGGVLILEALALRPYWMSATNTWWLAEHNPTRFALSGADLEYKQNFRLLADAAGDRGLQDVRVVYPALAPSVLEAYLPSARLVSPGDSVEPGWYAINVMVEQYLPALAARPTTLPGLAQLASAWSPIWQQVRAGEDHGYIAGTFHLYRVPLESDPPRSTVRGGDAQSM